MASRRLPASVYWRRRAIVLGLPILLIGLLIFFWPSSSADPKPKAEPTSTPTAATPTPTTPAKASSKVSVTLATGSKACEPGDVQIMPSVKAGQKAHRPVTLDLAVTTRSAKGCVFTASPSNVLAVMSAGKTAVWDSSVCKAKVLPEPVALSPGWSTLVQATWNARGSGSGCSPKEGWATPGKYVLKIATLGGEPSETTFTLDQPPPKPKPKPSAKPSPKPSGG